MRWHTELLIEFILLCVLWYRTAPCWFSILIGVDFCAGLLQLLLHRSSYPLLSRSFWIAGVVIAGPLVYKALMEGQYLKLTLLLWWHVRILCFWIAAQLTLTTLQTQSDLLLPANHALLLIDALCFCGWIACFGCFAM